MANILVVEDDEMISRMLQLRLELSGHQVDTAANGEEGADKALAGAYDLVLMDIHMPVMDGYEATHRLRGQDYSGTIVALTSSVMSKDTCDAIDAGCDHFLAKPIGPDFEEQIRGILGAVKNSGLNDR
ncbi:MAG: response regulator [Candidatus Thiodiazotropha sp. (ex Dulcina madagascariensis)]|nr:response regulator [Candidatus Thiodiazotropha sp. (ex Dulcina madagascariensis)]